MSNKKNSQGKAIRNLGLEAATRYLKLKGYEVLEREWECFAGKANIIALDGDCLVFVEVKTRPDAEHGFPAEAVNAKKREKYECIAAAYLQGCRFSDFVVRFDMVGVISLGADSAFIRHHINAFA